MIALCRSAVGFKADCRFSPATPTPDRLKRNNATPVDSRSL